MAISFTQQDLDILKAALVSGAKEVQIGDRKIAYDDKAQILALIKTIESSLSATPDESVDLVQATFSKGSR